MKWFQAIVLACALTVAQATTVILTASTSLIPSQPSTVYSLDTETGDFNKLLDISYPDEDMGAYSSATVCGNKYYGVWTNVPTSWGIFTVDLETNEMTHKTKTTTLWHKMTCDPNSPGDLVGVASKTDGSFAVVKFDSSTQTDSIVADFPSAHTVWAGSDTIFQFNSEDNPTTVYAAFLVSDPISAGGTPGGLLLVLSLETGELQYKAHFPVIGIPVPGNPYFVLPTTLNGTDMQGVMSYYKGGAMVYNWANLHLPENNGTITYDKEQEVTSIVDASSQPQIICDGSLFSFVQGSVGVMRSISMINPANGDLIKSFDLELLPNQVWGAMGC